MSKCILLKQNSEAIRKKITDAGIHVCFCASFVDSVWLDYYDTVGDVHGMGYPHEGMTAEETLALVEYEWKEYKTEVLECKTVEEFIQEILKTKQD